MRFDLQRSIVSNKEVFDFLESAAKKYGIEFWGPGSGIIHQIVLESKSNLLLNLARCSRTDPFLLRLLGTWSFNAWM